METATELVVFALVLCSRGVQLATTCSANQDCPDSKLCCGDECVDGWKACKIECLTESGCNSSRGEECVNDYCECVAPSCLLASNQHVKFTLCTENSDCSDGEKCRNRTCGLSRAMTTAVSKPQGLPLNPALLAIVTIIGVLIFSFLFCCCLSKMKSERTSVKRREAKGKLKKHAELAEYKSDNDNTGKPLLQAAQIQDSSNSFKKKDGSAVEKKLVLPAEKGPVISIVITGSPLSPIREEDEEVESEEN